MKILDRRTSYKPFHYPELYTDWENHEQMHWLPDEVPMGDDVKDWKTGALSEKDKALLMNIFRFFVQADIDVGCTWNKLAVTLKHWEAVALATGIANREAIHVKAYAFTLDTLGIDDSIYSEFLKYPEMVAKHEFADSVTKHIHKNDKMRLAQAVASGAMNEGVALFSLFAILLSFPARGMRGLGRSTMKGQGQQITWIARDETLHALSGVKIFRILVREYKNEINQDELIIAIKNSARQIVALEDAFIDLAFSQGDVEGLCKDELKQYVRYRANTMLHHLGVNSVFDVNKNPLGWLDEVLNGVEHANFFEQRATEYTRSATTGTWQDVFSNPDMAFGIDRAE